MIVVFYLPSKKRAKIVNYFDVGYNYWQVFIQMLLFTPTYILPHPFFYTYKPIGRMWLALEVGYFTCLIELPLFAFGDGLVLNMPYATIGNVWELVFIMTYHNYGTLLTLS